MADHVVHVVHPGYVRSVNDGDRHYIGFSQLVRLYQLPPYARTIDSRHPMAKGQVAHLEANPLVEVKHYYPRQDGKYDEGAQ